jgi:hypothetical protein
MLAVPKVPLVYFDPAETSILFVPIAFCIQALGVKYAN